MVLIRRYYFLKRCAELINAHRSAHRMRVRVLRETARRATDDEAAEKVAADDATACLETDSVIQTQLSASEFSGQQSLPRASNMEQISASESFRLHNITLQEPDMQRRTSKHRQDGLPSASVPRRTPAGVGPDAYGDFPGPFSILKHFFRLTLPKSHDFLARTLTIQPATTTANPDRVPWLDFDGLKISRNSNFNLRELDSIQLEYLGGLEYRALCALSWIVITYFVISQLVPFLILAPYLAATSRYNDVFAQQYRVVPKAWFVAFQMVSSYTGGGLSLSDASMLPFIDSVPLCLFTAAAVLLGNMAMPIFLRLFIWSLKKSLPVKSQLRATLAFVRISVFDEYLKHP